MALIITPTVTYASSCRYDEGFLQGVSGAELKGTHTQELMSGYLNARRLITTKDVKEFHVNRSPSSGRQRRYPSWFSSAMAW